MELSKLINEEYLQLKVQAVSRSFKEFLKFHRVSSEISNEIQHAQAKIQRVSEHQRHLPPRFLSGLHTLNEMENCIIALCFYECEISLAFALRDDISRIRLDIRSVIIKNIKEHKKETMKDTRGGERIKILAKALSRVTE
jgi:hypothetical protein